MLEVIYRVYEVADEKTADENAKLCGDCAFELSISQARNIELLMDCIICESREHFKDIIRNQYGEDIKFRYSKKLNPGDLYCVIIGEHCWNTERYFNKVEFVCDHCNCKLTTYAGKPIYLSNYEISSYLYSIDEYHTKRFCSQKCKSDYIESEKSKICPGDNDHFWIDKEGFNKIKDEHVIGYIYKITKKSTGEFYIGQTQYVPIFRWGEHLHTSRFPLKNISDYMFEVITPVYKGQNILEIEKSYIQSSYIADPDRSLNIAGTHNLI